MVESDLALNKNKNQSVLAKRYGYCSENWKLKKEPIDANKSGEALSSQI